MKRSHTAWAFVAAAIVWSIASAQTPDFTRAPPSWQTTLVASTDGAGVRARRGRFRRPGWRRMSCSASSPRASTARCGITVHPDTVARADGESAIIYGLSAVMCGEIAPKDGRVEQTSVGDNHVPRIDEALIEMVRRVKLQERGIGQRGDFELKLDHHIGNLQAGDSVDLLTEVSPDIDHFALPVESRFGASCGRG